MAGNQYKLKKMVELTGIDAKTLQAWDRRGIFVAHRTDTGRRYYTDDDVSLLLSNEALFYKKASRELTEGDMYGYLQVLSCVDVTLPVSRRHYRCKCVCGNEVVVRRGDLLSGNTTSCGCKRTEAFVRRNNCLPDGTVLPVISLSDLPGHHRTADFTGIRFGRLVVSGLERAYMRNCGKAAVIWRCKCDCGNDTCVDAQALRSGHTRSCGCYERENPSRLVNLTGRRFGKLVVLYRSDKQSTNRRYVMWHCKCDCGNECDVVSADLVHGMTSSCGCLKSSKRELFVKNYFDELGFRFGIDYIAQKTYDDLRGVGGRVLSYDFLVCPDGASLCLIECQGEQHYFSVEWYGGQEKFEQQQEHDRRKREYANSIGVPLLEVMPDCKTQESVRDAVSEFFHSIGYR